MPGLLGTSLNTDDILETLRGIGRGLNFGGTSGMIGAPVDMATAVLNNPGLLHPGLLGVQGLGIKDPVGGSKWIEQKLQNQGLLPQRQGNWQESVGELASTFINPMTAAAVAGPKLYAAEQRAIENAMAPTTLNKQTGAIVWHGSPHKFDKFDSSKIGTGEGAQAYGHGLYLAEAPSVAKSYADTLSQYHIGTRDGVKSGGDFADALVANAGDYPASLSSAIRSQANKVATDLAGGKTAEQVIASMRNGPYARMYSGLADAVEKMSPTKAGGSLYKVDLPDDAIAKMLDWDKPLSQQAPGVQAAIKRTRSMLPANAIDDLGGDLSLLYGRDVGADSFLGTMNSIQPNLGEALLQKAGIPGVRYLDGGSRGAGSGTSNFVVFPGNEDLLRILERNGQPIGLLGR